MSDAITPAAPKKRASRSGSEKRRRGGFFILRGTEGEIGRIKEAADRAGLTVSSYARSRMLAAPETRARHRPTIERALMAQAVALLGRAIGNLHQIARQLNFGNVEYADDLSAAVAEARSAIAATMAAAGRTPRGDGV
jgi:hypothetical protein